MNGLMLRDKLHTWTQNFDEAITEWESWLLSADVAYLSGDFKKLSSEENRGARVLNVVRELYVQRDQILTEASEFGFAARNLCELCEMIEKTGQRPLRRLIVSFVPRLRALRQHTIALWVTAFEAQDHTNRILRILSTGEERASTYHPMEDRSLGGGQFVNEAA